jgi:hypothetical protein
VIRPVLTHPTTAVVGGTDLGRAAAFFGAMGALPYSAPDLSACAAGALYGLDRPLRQIVLRTPGSATTVRLVETPNAAPPFRALDTGAYGLDIFTRDLDVTMSGVRATGGHNITPLVPYGPERTIQPDAPDFLNQEVLFQGPDEITVYITDTTVSTNEWPTILHTEPRQINSEIVMLCWVVPDNDVERAFWENEAQLVVVGDGYPDNDAMVKLMYHPRPTPLRCVNLSDAASGTKMELMSYPEEETTQRPEWPLVGGFHGAHFEVADLDNTMTALPSASFGEVVVADDGEGERRAVTGVSPGGVRFELWETNAAQQDASA